MRAIKSDPAIFGGKPVIEGTRISVEQVLGLLSKGMTPAAIVSAWPILREEDVFAALAYAQSALRNDVVLNVA